MSASETIERVVHGDADVQIGKPRRRLSGLRSDRIALYSGAPDGLIERAEGRYRIVDSVPLAS
jgi:hypothetical protein